MTLLKNISHTGTGIEGEVFFELFDRNFAFLTDKISDLNFVEKHAACLNTMPERVIDALANASVRYYNGFLGRVGEKEQVFDTARDLFSLIYPQVLIIPYPQENQDSILHLELNCEWDAEHGMAWIVRNRSILYVGAFNGMDPWGDYQNKDAWNYA